jgi:putative hydrolase of the HAD superfamily
LTRYRHYSFDVWQTLIRSNPAFRATRTAWFADRYNPHRYDLAEVERRMKEADLLSTRINERVGRNIDARELMLLMMDRLGVDIESITPAEVQQTEAEIGRLFVQHPPLLTDPDLPRILQTLRAGGATLSLLSNTGLVRGSGLSAFFASVGIGKLLAFELYSDEVMLSKPNPAFFARLFQQARQLSEHQAVDLRPEQILHVGDNPLADRDGAEAAGLHALLLHAETPDFGPLLA